jgi:hypothetical protein
MRKSFFFYLTCIIFINTAIAQKKAITDKGDEVILYDDGTWKYATSLNREEKPFEINPVKFTRDKAGSFLLKSNRIHVGFWLDPKKWKFYKAVNNEDAEFQMELREQSTQVVIISEKVQISLESLHQIVLTTLKAASPDLLILHEEYRMVNGLKVLYVQARGTISGMKANFYNYYYSDSSCTLQYDVIGLNKDAMADKKNAEELLNGLVALPDGNNDSSIVAPGKNEDNNKVVSQGSLSPNNECKKYFAGKWTYVFKDTNVVVERSLEKTIEHYGNNSYEYDNKWITNCEYQLIFRKTTVPNYIRVKPGEVILINIMEIDNEVMRYTSTFRGIDGNGEMTRFTAKR